jgi:DNA-binding PadR family transcriptional regulator
MRVNQSTLGRFSAARLLVLVSLAGGNKHSYAMLIDAHETFGVTLSPRTLNGAIDRLEQKGLIEAVPSNDRHPPYRITAIGVKELQEQLTNMQQLTAAGLERLAAR